MQPRQALLTTAGPDLCNFFNLNTGWEKFNHRYAEAKIICFKWTICQVFLVCSYKDKFLKYFFSHYQYPIWKEITPSLNIPPLLICHGSDPNLDYYNSILTLLFASSSSAMYSCEKVRKGQNSECCFFFLWKIILFVTWNKVRPWSELGSPPFGLSQHSSCPHHSLLHHWFIHTEGHFYFYLYFWACWQHSTRGPLNMPALLRL